MYNEKSVIKRLMYQKYGHVDVNKEDLLQAGYLGYLQAIKNFNEMYGTLSMAYAKPYILKEMSKFIQSELQYRTNTCDISLENFSSFFEEIDVQLIDIKNLLSDLSFLTEEERMVITQVFIESKKLNDVALAMGISSARASQIKKSALEKIRNQLL